MAAFLVSAGFVAVAWCGAPSQVPTDWLTEDGARTVASAVLVVCAIVNLLVHRRRRETSPLPVHLLPQQYHQQSMYITSAGPAAVSRKFVSPNVPASLHSIRRAATSVHAARHHSGHCSCPPPGCSSTRGKRAGLLAGMRPVASNRAAQWRLHAGEGCYGPPRPVQIIPSVLPADFGKLGADCKMLEDAGCDRIQFDVMDGNFVPNLTFGPDTIRWCRGYTSLPFETQLMVSERCTDAMLDIFTEATKGPNGEPGVVIVHVEACTHLHRALGRIRAAGGSPSVALNPHTPAEMIENVLDMVDHVLVMTVNPGFGGQAYIPTMTNKIRKIRKWIVDRGLDVDIEVDGGIKATPETIGACAAAGANCFIAGSGLFAYDDMSMGVKELTVLAEAGQKGEL